MGETVTTHLSFVTEVGDMSTMPSGYFVAVHVGGVVKTYSASVDRPVAFDCTPDELPASLEAEVEVVFDDVARLSIASSAGRFLENRSGRVTSTNTAI